MHRIFNFQQQINREYFFLLNYSSYSNDAHVIDYDHESWEQLWISVQNEPAVRPDARSNLIQQDVCFQAMPEVSSGYYADFFSLTEAEQVIQCYLNIFVTDVQFSVQKQIVLKILIWRKILFFPRQK